MDQLLINQLLQAQQVAIKAQEVTITALQDENKNLKIEVDKLNKELAQRFSSSKFLKLKRKKGKNFHFSVRVKLFLF
jgi:hypothetical protein